MLHFSVSESVLLLVNFFLGNLEGFGFDQAYRAAEDETIRRVMRGIWFNLFVSEVILVEDCCCSFLNRLL